MFVRLGDYTINTDHIVSIQHIRDGGSTVKFARNELLPLPAELTTELLFWIEKINEARTAQPPIEL